MQLLKGVATSPGVAIGTVRVIDAYAHLDVPFHKIGEEDIAHEIDRFQTAVEKVRQDLEKTIEQAAASAGADVFAVHLMITQDDAFCSGVTQRIREKQQNVESILKEVVEEFSRMFTSLKDAYAREKAADIRDVGQRVLNKLLFVGSASDVLPGDGQYVVAARELTPSVTMHLHPETVLGFLSEFGSPASHGSVLARSLGVPAVVGLDGLHGILEDGTRVIIDGSEGKVYLDPSPEMEEQYRHALDAYRSREEQLLAHVDLPAVTVDGEEIELKSNIGNVVDLELSTRYGARGIGLYRTEFPFLELDRFPSEDEQYAVYRRVLEEAGGYGVNMRVLDIGGDKFLPYLEMPEQVNPNLGWRGLRVLFDHPGIFGAQVRAMLRASVHGDLGIMLPMVASIEEIRKARLFIEQKKQDIIGEGKPLGERVRLGVMIEVPSSIFILDQILAEVDFISIGTNDLIQYLLAIDRNERTVSGLYEPLHPAVLHALEHIAESTARAGKPATLCGEMAGVPDYIGILLGLGFRSFSITPRSIPLVKEAVRRISLKSCGAVTSQITRLATVSEVKAALRKECRCGCFVGIDTGPGRAREVT